ncbi:hypothetical protein [Lacrimispora xylanisolvens]
MHYSNNPQLIEKIKNYWTNISTEQEDCICKYTKADGQCDK